MKNITKRILPLLLALVLVCASFITVSAKPAAEKIVTTPTGYTKAGDVDYLKVTDEFYDPKAKKDVTLTVVANWGARGENAVFLSSYAVDFYTAGNTYQDFSGLSGSKQQKQVPESALFKALQVFMESNHTYYTEYKGSKNVRAFYKYTDCVSNDTTQVSVLYRGTLVTSQWNSGDIWNQEHTWPQSKCTSDWQVGDIMQLRPSNPSENSGRGNDCYGEKSSSDYYDPGISVRGDCARMMLYMYVRWGNTSKMWGSSGVMESVDILLKWMQEDPVDTWEMGRNDSVQSITGTRNVFVDYPELAWLLFGKEIPSDMTTPSGGKSTGTTPPPECTHATTKLVNKKAATCTADGYTGDTVCAQCSKKLESGTAIPAGHKDDNQDQKCDACGKNLCPHPQTELKNEKASTCQAEGYSGDQVCTTCGETVTAGHALPMGEHQPTVTGQKDATCGEDGYSGDTICGNCSEPIIDGTVIPATGSHSYGDWMTEKEATTKETGLQTRTCTECGHKESQELPVLETSYTWVIVTVVVAAAVCTAGVVLFILKRKK